jgi:fructokinase
VATRSINPRLGIDLGGTKIEAALLDRDNNVCWRKRIPTPRNDYDQTIAAIISLIHDVRHEVPESLGCTVGMGIPGSVSPLSGRIRNANSTWLNGQPLGKDLEAILGHPVSLANDANCLALSESVDGAGQNASTMFAVILGTGVGGGLCVNGKIITGANGIAGEWGHTLLGGKASGVLAQEPCWCGRYGCIETHLSGPALIRAYHQTPQSDPTVVCASQLIERYRASEPAAHAAVTQFFNHLACALAMVINIIDPEVIVIGGGLSQVDEIYTEVPNRWGEWIFSDTPTKTRLCPAAHGDASGVRGAAWLTDL